MEFKDFLGQVEFLLNLTCAGHGGRGPVQGCDVLEHLVSRVLRNLQLLALFLPPVTTSVLQWMLHIYNSNISNEPVAVERGEVERACGPVREEGDVDEQTDAAIAQHRTLQLLLALVELQGNLIMRIRSVRQLRNNWKSDRSKRLGLRAPVAP